MKFTREEVAEETPVVKEEPLESTVLDNDWEPPDSKLNKVEVMVHK